MKKLTTTIYDETYAVRADWANAASPVEQLGEEGWVTTQYQAGDFRHDAREALRQIMLDSLSYGGDVDGAELDEAVEAAQ